MSTSLFGLPVARASKWIFNCYLISSEDSVTVVDPGLPVVAHEALRLIRADLGRDPADIAAVLCTHGHPDHVGGVPTIQKASNANVHLPQRCSAYLKGEKPRNFPLVESSLRFLSVYQEQPFSWSAVRDFATLGRKVGFGGPPMMHLDFEPNGFLADGQKLTSVDGWEIIHTPGHTDDSTCFYHSDTATLISGDAVVTQDGRAWFNPEYVDLDLAHSTEERLRALEVRHLLPGHGVPIQASNVWTRARTSLSKPTGSKLLARCSRRLARWD